jgi:hypothetical protein
MRHLITSLALLTLAACGGGGGGSSSNTLSGTAATGAPMAGASIEVYNSSGIKVATATADSSGKYTSSALLGDGPYVIKATSGTTELYSVQSSADGSVVNVTPLSNLVATLLSPTGNAGNLVTEFGADKTLLSSTGINDKKTIVKSIAAPVANVIGGIDANFDVINTAMVANGTGLDQVLDTVRIGITHEGSSSSIQVVYKTADGTSTPQTITFSNSDARSNVIASVNGITFQSRDLFDSSMTVKLNAWLDRLNTCNRIPASQRWTGSVGSKTLIADACKKLFYNNDPALFRHFGVTAEQAFTYTYGNRTWTEAEPSRQVTEPEYVYTNSDGEVIVKMRAKLFNDDDTTYYRYYFFNLSPDINNNNELRSRGNQYIYETNMSVVNYIKSFPYSSGYNYTYSGYSLDIPTEGTNGDSSIASIPYNKTIVSAKVTSPTGEITYLKKKTGRSRLVVCPTSTTLADNCSYSPFRAVGSTFLDSTTAPDIRYSSRTKPAEYDSYGSVNFGQLSDPTIRNLPMIGTYTVELTLSDNSVVTQRVPFFGRPRTHQEIITARSNNKFPLLSSEFISNLFRSRTDDLSAFRQSSEMSVWPVKWISDTNQSMGVEPTSFIFSWSNLAQYIFMHGQTTGTGYFELRKEISTAERTKTFDCFQYASVNACNGSTSQFKWNQTGDSKFSVIQYMEIGNYFSDFGTNISAYEFYAIENGDRNPYVP